MSTRKRKSTATASQEGATEVAAAFQVPATGFAVCCSIQSELLEMDERCFDDFYEDEIEWIKQEAKESAAAHDGTWIWDSTSGTNAGVAGGSGSPVFFITANAANKAAAEVWVSLLLSLSERPCTPLLDQLAEQAQTSSRAGSARQAQNRSKKAASQGKAGSAQECDGGTPTIGADADALEQQLQEMFAQPGQHGLSVLMGGRASWEASVRWFDNPPSFDCTEPIRNTVCSAVQVEMVQADLR